MIEIYQKDFTVLFVAFNDIFRMKTVYIRVYNIYSEYM